MVYRPGLSYFCIRRLQVAVWLALHGLKAAGKTSAIARKIVNSPQPAANAEEWKARVDYARQVDTYTAYSLFAAALKASDTDTPTLFEALEKQHPKSEYLAQLSTKYLVAVSKAEPAKLIPTAEHLAQIDPNNEDVLLVLADSALANKNNTQALDYSEKLMTLLNSKPKPEGLDDAVWQAKNNAGLGRAYWTKGVASAIEEKFEQADQALRAALPHIQDNQQLLPGALFYLGLTDYRLVQTSKNKTQMADSLKFSRESAAMASPYQSQAAQNVKVIQREFRLK